MAVDKKILILTFVTSKGNDVKVTINCPTQNLAPQTISTIMDTIVGYGAFSSHDDTVITKKKNAMYVQTENRAIELM